MSDATRYFEPVIVTGTGRCGTSTVARLFGQRFRYLMGDLFREPDAANPDGYWEDITFRDANEALLTRQMSESEWRKVIENLLINRRARYYPWGIKDPRITQLHELYRDYFPGASWILCIRDRESTIDSMVRHYASLGWTREDASAIYDERTAKITEILKSGVKSLSISFTDRVSEESLIEAIGTFIGGSHG